MNLFNKLIEFKNSKEWIAFEKYYGKVSILEQIDFFRFEDANTNFLASLLKESNPYNLGDYPLRLLCELIASKDTDNKFPFIRKICFSNCDLSNIYVKTQELLDGARLDLLITFSVVYENHKEEYLIALEAKFDSLEHDKQCEKYRNELEQLIEYNSHNKAYIYLSLTDTDDISDEEHYLKITYQDLINYVYEPCSYKSDNKNLLLTLNEYINSFSSLYGKERMNIKYIPITTEGKILTLAVWNKNKDIIANFIEKASTDDVAKAFYLKYQKLLKILFINLTKMNDIVIEDDYISTFDTITRIAQNIRARNKLHNKYYSDSEFIYQVFKDIISKEAITDYKQLDIVNTHKFIYSQDEYNKSKTKIYHTIDKYGRLSIPENTYNYYYYSNNHTDTEILELIELIKTTFPNNYNDDNLKRLENINELLKNKE